MSSSANFRINFADTIKSLQSDQVWEYETGSLGACRDVTQSTFQTLQRPIDFPPIEGAIVPGDRIALAVDPNVPHVVEVVLGTLQALSQTPCGEVDVVVWDEATDQTIDAIREAVGDAAQVFRHSLSDRALLRYLGANEFAEPLYLNRRLVDADFVLPIVAARPLDVEGGQDLTGIFPAFADSVSRQRHRENSIQETDEPSSKRGGLGRDRTGEPSWLLGVQIMVSVIARNRGDVGQVLAGTPEAIGKQLKPTRRLPDAFPPAAPLVIASLDGDQQQQTWCNVARALAAASRFVQHEGTIVLWSAVSEKPSAKLLSLIEDAASIEPTGQESTGAGAPLADDEDFPLWDDATSIARTLARIVAENRVLIHSQLEVDAIEAMGMGAIGSADELTRLSQTFEACGVLRAAQFEGTTFDTAPPAF